MGEGAVSLLGIDDGGQPRTIVTPGPWRQMPAVMAGSAVRAGGTIAHPHRTSRPRHAATDQPDPADSLDHEGAGQARSGQGHRSEEHTSELQSLMRSSYSVFRLKKK